MLLPPPLTLKLADFPENVAGSILLQVLVEREASRCHWKLSSCSLGSNTLCLSKTTLIPQTRKGVEKRWRGCFQERKKEWIKDFLYKKARIDRQRKATLPLKPLHSSLPAKTEKMHYLSCRKEVLSIFSDMLEEKSVHPQKGSTLPSRNATTQALSNRATFLNAIEENTPLLVSLTPSRALSFSLQMEEAISNMLKPGKSRKTRCIKEISSFYQHVALSFFPLDILSKSKTVEIHNRKDPLWLLLSLGLLLIAAIVWRKKPERRRGDRFSVQKISPPQILALAKDRSLLIGSFRWNEDSLQTLLTLAQKMSENIGEVLLVEWGHQEISRKKRWTSPFSIRDFHTGKAMASFAWQTIRQQGKIRREDYFYEIAPQIYFIKGQPEERRRGTYDPDPRIFAPFKIEVILFLLSASKRTPYAWQTKEKTLLWIKNKWCTIYGQ